MHLQCRIGDGRFRESRGQNPTGPVRFRQFTRRAGRRQHEKHTAAQHESRRQLRRAGSDEGNQRQQNGYIRRENAPPTTSGCSAVLVQLNR